MNTEFTDQMYQEVLNRITKCTNVIQLQRMLIDAIENADLDGTKGIAEFIYEHELTK